MKRITLLATMLLAAGIAGAQTTAPAPAAAPSQIVPKADALGAAGVEIETINGQKYMKWAVLGDVKTNQNFQANVNNLLQYRQGLEELARRRNQAITTPEREALAFRLILLNQQVSNYNDEMIKQFGYSLLRNYYMRIVKSRIYKYITPAEFEKMPESERSRPDNIISRQEKNAEGKEDTKRYKYFTTIEGVESNDGFRSSTEKYQQTQNISKQYGQHILNPNVSKEDKDKATVELSKIEKTQSEIILETERKYKISVGEDFVQEIENSILYSLVTEEEIAKIKQQIEENKRKPAAPAATTPAR